MEQTWSKGGSRVIIPFAPQSRNNNSNVLWFVITQTKSVRYSCERVWPRPNPQDLSPDSNFLYLKALYYPGWRRTGPFKSVQSCRNRDCSSINFNWSFSWNNHTIIWRIVAKNLVHSDLYSKINLALSRNFHDTMKSLYSTKLFGKPIICKDIVVSTWPYHSERTTRQLTHFHNRQNGIAVLSVLVQLMQYIFWVLSNDQINIQQKSVCNFTLICS